MVACNKVHSLFHYLHDMFWPYKATLGYGSYARSFTACFPWAMLDNKWLCSAKSWLPPMSASPLSPPPWPWHSTPIGERSPDLPPLYACLGRNEQLSLCSLEGFPLGVGLFLTSSEPISKFGHCYSKHLTLPSGTDMSGSLFPLGTQQVNSEVTYMTLS
jgi:hypothetical protein